MVSELVKKRLNDGLTLYRITGKGPLPRVLLPTGVLMGEVTDSGYLIKLLREQLTAPVAAPALTPQSQQQPQQPQPGPAPASRPPAGRPSPFSDRLIG
jgi:hypothetical protein